MSKGPYIYDPDSREFRPKSFPAQTDMQSVEPEPAEAPPAGFGKPIRPPEERNRMIFWGLCALLTVVWVLLLIFSNRSDRRIIDPMAVDPTLPRASDVRVFDVVK